MSLYARKNFGYLQQAEAFFLSMSRRGLMLGSKDTELLRHWREVGIPIEVVCGGIRNAFEAYKDPPRGISQCRRMVEKELHAWRQRHAGTHDTDATDHALRLPGKDLPDPTDPERRRKREALRQRFEAARQPSLAPQIPDDERFLAVWYQSMWRLMDLGQQSETELGRDMYRWAYKQMQELRQEALEMRLDPRVRAEVPLVIGEIEAAMFDKLYESLSEPARERLDASLPDDIAKALERMSADARSHQRKLWRRRAIEAQMAFHPFFTP